MVGQRLVNDAWGSALLNHSGGEIVGEQPGTGVVGAGAEGVRREIPADGVFIEHGLVAQTDFVGALVERTASGHIVVDDRCATRCAGLFAAGDITSSACAEQILIALGEGVKASLSACSYLFEVALARTV
jgi:alkyl hydroperoxide reductase subunit F